MIVVDTSALMAIVPDEPRPEACIKALEAEAEVLISAGTIAEANRRNV
jgi:ribonuclease VapC